MTILLTTRGRPRGGRPCFVHCTVVFSQAVEITMTRSVDINRTRSVDSTLVNYSNVAESRIESVVPLNPGMENVHHHRSAQISGFIRSAKFIFQRCYPTSPQMQSHTLRLPLPGPQNSLSGGGGNNLSAWGPRILPPPPLQPWLEVPGRTDLTPHSYPSQMDHACFGSWHHIKTQTEKAVERWWW